MPVPPGSYTQLPPNSTGPKLATGPTYTENSQTVQDEKVILGEQYLASYMIVADASTATVNSHLIQIMAGASLRVRVRRIEIHQLVMATTAAIMSVGFYRLTTAGTGGGAVTPGSLDPADAASGATAMTLPTGKGTEGTLIAAVAPYMMQTVGASAQLDQPIVVLDFDRLRSKPLIIAAGTTNGLAIKNLTAIAGGQVRIDVWIDEASWS